MYQNADIQMFQRAQQPGAYMPSNSYGGPMPGMAQTRPPTLGFPGQPATTFQAPTQGYAGSQATLSGAAPPVVARSWTGSQPMGSPAGSSNAAPPAYNIQPHDTSQDYGAYPGSGTALIPPGARDSQGHNSRGKYPPGGAVSSKAECSEQQCAEEECDPDECGDETRAPRDDNHTCGVDRRPLLPVVLIISTAGGALQFAMFEFPLARDVFANANGLRAFFSILYVLTLGLMIYCALGDPGQLSDEKSRQAYAQVDQDGALSDDKEPPLPPRAHKTWLYKYPVRRYDHYCRWVTNVIGLLNHREFVVMVTGLVTIGISGSMFDFILLFYMPHDLGHWITGISVILHLAYSVILTAVAAPILRLHIGFISRNELANEWKKNDFYVAILDGMMIPVNDLSEQDFNDHFDYFIYDKTRNPFDKGFSTNCWAFWCTPRWPAAQLGSF